MSRFILLLYNSMVGLINNDFLYAAFSSAAWLHLGSQLLVWTHESFYDEDKTYRNAARAYEYCMGSAPSEQNEFINCDEARKNLHVLSNYFTFCARVMQKTGRKLWVHFMQSFEASFLFLAYRFGFALFLSYGAIRLVHAMHPRRIAHNADVERGWIQGTY